ncbi:MAG TPA: DUF4838 domain-containing protein [Chthoniobacteraceae bacterium]|nr:DUF4838 domain-containing protein [Chthoniobacteraceae bacterium]
MWKPLLAALVFFSWAGARVMAQEERWPLEKGAFVILLSDAPSPSEAFAAEELQTYFQKMSGAGIAIRKGEPSEGERAIIVGRHPVNGDLLNGLDDPDHYRIESTPERIGIVGGYRPPVVNAKGQEFVSDWGILYGVYQLLEEQGIRWYRPEPDGEVVPKSGALRVITGKRDFQPAFSLRWGVALYATSRYKAATPEQTEMARIWALRNRCNVTGLADPKYGGSLRIGGGGHSYDALVPRKLFDEHPDFFPLIDGKRTPKGQICHGNPELQEFFAQQVIARAGENPQWFMTSIDPNDGGGWCECERCAAMDDPKVPSGRGGGLSMASRLALFNNIIAEKVGEKFPDLLLYCLAYAQYTEAPTRVDHLEKNLLIGLAPFAGAYSDYSRALSDPQSLPNSRFLKSMRDYAGLGVRMYAREYLSYYAWPGPLPLLWVMQDRFREYRKYGFIGAYSETHPSWGPQGMILYMYLRLLWNPDLDLQAELESYCHAFYGPAAGPMLRYHQLIEERGKNGPYFGSGGSHAENLFTDAFLAALAPHVKAAAQSVKGQAPYEWRVEAVLAGYEFARLYRSAANAIAGGRFEQARERLDALDFFYSEKYPEGDVFNKGDGRHRKADGTFVRPGFLRTLYAELEKADSIEKRFRNPRRLQALDKAWKFRVDPDEQGIAHGWQQPSLDDAGWDRINSGSPWQHQGHSNFRGTAWYRRNFPTPGVEGGRRVVLVFEAVDGDATVWLNGKEVGRHELIDPLEGTNRWNDPFTFDVTGFLNRGPLNSLVVRVRKTDGNGGIHRTVKLLEVDAE